MPTIPSFITEHPIFKHHNIRKVFPSIGLKDCRTKIDIKPEALLTSLDAHKVFIDGMLKKIIYFQTLPDKTNIQHTLQDLVPLQGHYIEFSSNAFDLITRSMRGLNSCVNWMGERKNTLVGSVICPYEAVILITNSSDTEYGKTIEYRSIVRLVQVGTAYGLLLDRTYCFSELFMPYVRWLFKTYLKENCAELPIYDALATDMTIPLSEPVKELIDYDFEGKHISNQGWVSYRDSSVQYGKSITLTDWSKIIPKKVAA